MHDLFIVPSFDNHDLTLLKRGAIATPLLIYCVYLHFCQVLHPLLLMISTGWSAMRLDPRVVITTYFIPYILALQDVFNDEKQDSFCLSPQTSTLLQLAPHLEGPQCSSHQNHPTKAKSEPSPRTPWTHEPQCLTSAYNNQSYCVYTSANSHTQRGISLFTTPLLASKAASHPAFLPSPSPPPSQHPTPPYLHTPIPGKGNGLLATSLLHRGSLIHAHPPIGIYSIDALMADHNTGYMFLNRSVSQLGEQGRALFWGMGNTRTEEEGVKGWETMGRVETNGFGWVWEGEEVWVVLAESAVRCCSLLIAINETAQGKGRRRCLETKC